MGNQNKKDLKHLGSFWPLFIIVIISMVAGGIVYAFASGNVLQDEIDSISFPAHTFTQKSVKKLPAKPVVKTEAVKK
jgi:hypothetical protein